MTSASSAHGTMRYSMLNESAFLSYVSDIGDCFAMRYTIEHDDTMNTTFMIQLYSEAKLSARAHARQHREQDEPRTRTDVSAARGAIYGAQLDAQRGIQTTRLRGTTASSTDRIGQGIGI
jgi:hypothetical protein